MGILSWIVMGGLAGWVASMIMKKNSSMGIIGNIIVGIVGAFIGGFVVNLVGGYGVSGFDFRSFLVALLGAVILLAIINIISKGKAR
jgi:uncharacterized membrane protein YeaQ/YmgE (transglycosylase-associated protein family)